MTSPPARWKMPDGTSGDLVMTWAYLPEHSGLPLGFVARYQAGRGKAVVPFFRPDGRGGFAYGAAPEPRPLFGLQTLNRLTPIWIVEGEKAAAALHAIGLAAVTSPGGSGAAHAADWEPVRSALRGGRDVLVWPDNDAPGRAYAAAVYRLAGEGCECLLELPAGTPDVEKADAADWLMDGLNGLGIEWDGLVNPNLTEDHREALSKRLADEVSGIRGPAPVEWGGPNGKPAILNFLPFPSASLGWSEPEPLPAGLPPVEPFDLDMLPLAFRAWIGDIAERMQCPPDYPAVAALVCLAAVVGRQLGIRPKQKDDWTVIPNLWGAVIGRPSLLKTPAIQEPMRMIESLEASSREQYEAALRDYAAELMVMDAITKDAKDKVVKAVRAGDASLAHALALEATEAKKPPSRRRYLSQDVTVEKLGEILRDNPRGALIYRDELIGFLRGLDREGREGSRAFFLEAWNGVGRFTFDRIGRGTVEIEAACVSIIGGIQPGPLGSYLASALMGGAADDGLMQRFQLAVWPDTPGSWRNVDRWPNTEARSAARAVYQRLDDLDTAALGAIQDDADPAPWLRLDAEAQEIFNDWRECLEARLRDDDMPPAMESHLAKFRSLVPSLALLLHLADNAERGPVSGFALLKAIAWARYLESHSRRIYSTAIDQGMTAARELDRRMGQLPMPFSARDVWKRGWRLLDREGTAAALSILIDYGRIRGEGTMGEGRPTTRYTVNPALIGTAD